MAKKSKIARDAQRRHTVAVHAVRRAEIKATIKNTNLPQEERDAAQRKLQAMPRDASPTRLRNRCGVRGRSRGYLRKFGLSRIAFRELALRGEIPGVVKSSW